MAFFGECGPCGTGDSNGEVATGIGGLPGGVLAGFAPGDVENFDEMLDNHEFRRAEPVDGDTFLDKLPLNVAVLSDDAVLEKPGLCTGIGFGAAGVGSFDCWSFPFCFDVGSFSAGDLLWIWFDLE